MMSEYLVQKGELNTDPTQTEIEEVCGGSTDTFKESEFRLKNLMKMFYFLTAENKALKEQLHTQQEDKRILYRGWYYNMHDEMTVCLIICDNIEMARAALRRQIERENLMSDEDEVSIMVKSIHIARMHEELDFFDIDKVQVLMVMDGIEVKGV